MHLDSNSYNFLVQSSLIAAAVFEEDDLLVKAINAPMLKLLASDAQIINQSVKNKSFKFIDSVFIVLLEQVYVSGIDSIRKGVAIYIQQKDEISTRYFNISFKALKSNQNTTQAVFCTLEDVTVQILHQRHDLVVKERLAFSIKSAGIGIWDLDPIKKTLNLDTRCRELMGNVKIEDATYEGMLKNIHPGDIFRVGRAILNVMNPASPNEVLDIRFRAIDYNTKAVNWVNAKGHAYLDHKGRTYRFAGTVQDINEEVRARTREEQMLSLINHNANSMVIADFTGKYSYMNEAARKLLGVGPNDSITNLNTLDFFYDHKKYYEIDKEVRKNKENIPLWSGNVVLKNIKTKEAIPTELSFILIKDPHTGKVLSRGGIARDLRPEIKIKAEQERLNTIINSSEDFINYCDINGNTLYINPSGQKLVGLKKADYFNQSLFNYHSEDSVDRLKNEIFPKLHQEGKWSGTLELYNRETGEIIPIHKQMYMLKEEYTQKPVGIGGIARDLRPDINANKAIQNKNVALQNAIKEMEFLANSVPSVVWRSDSLGNLEYINRRWYEQSAHVEDKDINTQWRKNLHPDDLERVAKAWAHSIKTGEAYDIEFRSLDKNHQYQWYLVRSTPFRDEDGQIVKWYGSNTNIQVQKELEKQKDDFLGVASHELKTPVTSLKAYAQIIEAQFKKAGDVKSAEILAKMNKQINRLTVLISDLLDVTKLNSGRLEFNVSEFAFNEMIEEVIDEVQHTSPKFNFIRNLNFKGNYIGDRERLFQVMTNYLTNAVKYSPRGDTIIIYSDYQDDKIVVKVQDFGIGINEELKDKVFEQFYRVSGNKEITFPGLGLGLYVSAEIIKRLGGGIWVESKKNEGSIFGFSLPINNLV